MTDSTVITVEKTLTQIANILHAETNEEDAFWIEQVAVELRRNPDPKQWICCPLCEEVQCDSDCALREARGL